MDFASDWPTIVPSVGVLSLLAWLLIRLTVQSSGDRSDYQEQLQRLRVIHAAEINEITTRHDAQIEDLRNQIQTLRGEVRDLRVQLEAERHARWQAEDAAAKYRRMAGGDAAEELPT